jgi:hypothetical protein
VRGYDEYRNAALACIQLADTWRDPQSRMVLVRMVQMWAGLADQAVKNSRTDLTYETPRPRRRDDHAADDPSAGR